MKIKMNLVFLIIVPFSSSCISLTRSDNDPLVKTIENKKRINELINTDQLEAAREFMKQENMSDDYLVKIINKNHECSKAVKKCQGDIIDLQYARRCFKNIRPGCNYNSDMLSVNLRNVSSEIDDKLTKYIEKTSHSPQIEELCRSGMKWSYERVDKKNLAKCDRCMPFWSKTNYKQLTGFFKTKNECEENRILDKDNWLVKEECIERYIGEPKYFTTYEAKAMIVNDKNTIDMTLKFDSLEKCEQASKNGFTYIQSDYNEFIFMPKGSEESSRFIGSCQKKENLICIQDKDNSPNLGDVL